MTSPIDIKALMAKPVGHVALCAFPIDMVTARAVLLGCWRVRNLHGYRAQITRRRDRKQWIVVRHVNDITKKHNKINNLCVALPRNTNTPIFHTHQNDGALYRLNLRSD